MIPATQQHDNEWMHSATLPGEPKFDDLSAPEDPIVEPSNCNRFMLWIDGVGSWQVCLGTEFILGAPSLENPVADIPLLANISRQHATIVHDQESWHLKAHQQTFVSDQQVSEPVMLASGDQIRLGRSVRLGFRIPSVLSTSAVIDFESEHRPSHSVDGVVLLSDHCLLGARRDHHVRCPNWAEAVVLFTRDGQLRCRSKADLFVNDKMVRDSQRLTDGDIVSGEDFRFRVENIP